MKSSASKNKTTSSNGQTRSPETARPTHGGTAKPSLLEKFFTDQLKDMYWAEQQLLKVLPEFKKACSTEELEDAFDSHLKQTERHVQRLEKVFQMMQKKPEAKTCEAMVGLIREGREIISSTEKGSMTRDAALIIAAQKVEHYEIATYGGLVQLALTIGLDRAAELLDKTLCEEEQTDQSLTRIAEDYINMEAEKEGFSWNRQKETNTEEEKEEVSELAV